MTFWCGYDTIISEIGRGESPSHPRTPQPKRRFLMKKFLVALGIAIICAPLGAQTTPQSSWLECKLGKAPISPGPAPADAYTFGVKGGPVLMSEAGITKGAPARWITCILPKETPSYRGADGVLRDVASNQPYFPVGWDATPPLIPDAPTPQPGPQGLKGDKGDKGDQGPQGIPGTATSSSPYSGGEQEPRDEFRQPDYFTAPRESWWCHKSCVITGVVLVGAGAFAGYEMAKSKAPACITGTVGCGNVGTGSTYVKIAQFGH